MSDTLAAPTFKIKVWAFVQNQLATALVFTYQFLALIAFAILPITADQWFKTPFIGAFTSHTLVIHTLSPSQAINWELAKQDLPFGHQLVKVGDEPISNVRQLGQTLRGYPIQAEVTLTLQSPAGKPRLVQVTLQSFPSADRFTFFIIPYVIGLIYLWSSLWVFNLRRKDSAGRAFALFTAAAAVCIGGWFDILTSNLLTYFWTLSVALAAGALFNLALLFPQEIEQVADYPYFRWLGYVPSGLLALIALPTLYNTARPVAYTVAWRFEAIYLGLGVLYFLALTLVRRLSARSPIIREEARIILWGAGLSFTPIALCLLATLIWPTLPFSPYLLLLLTIFPILTGYNVLRYRLLNTDYLLSRMALYAVLGVLAVAAYTLFVTGIGLLIGSGLPSNHPILVGLMVFALVVIFQPARHFLQRRMDNVFFRNQAVHRERIQTFSGELTQLMDQSLILGKLREAVTQGVFPSRLHLFIYNPLGTDYTTAADETGKTTSDLHFPASSVLVQTLNRRTGALFLGGMETLPTPLQSERARLSLLDSVLFVPLHGQRQLVGWIALGPLRSGEPYSSQDLNYLESLCDQAAMAVERARVVASLEQRIREMNTLSRMAQGINITLAFDDILELIYAQTIHLIPAQDFHITLFDPVDHSLTHVFYLENNERLNDRENEPFQAGQGLVSEVILTQRSLLTQDYEGESLRRGFQPDESGLFAWIGVPLKAGAETIGAISLGSRDSSIPHTEEQRSLLQAIADQAAGAIVKARLLSETQQHARQMATLNEIGRSLTSTLALKPLLNQILESAAEILNCEAGSLFLLDEQTGELVFEVTVGPVAGDLVGQRLPPGAGLVGKAVQSGKPVIANDVRSKQGWFQKADQQTGFITRDLLVVPMQVKDRIIGVIEVINKIDGSPFDSKDQVLLATYTSQAAVAVENARLYTQTDKALTERVEELSVMQRIDRELNASLDLGRAMDITLEWAMRQSRADAGLVGIVEEKGIQVTAAQGYVLEAITHHDPAQENVKEGGTLRLNISLKAVEQAVQTGQVQVGAAVYPTGSSIPAVLTTLLPDAHGQVIVPIRRESKVIGFLLLESQLSELGSEESLAFLSRLSDHAAIAIANAQLYTAVQEANQAKSEFVSFVSHELKTPMTSIRGYADLLAAGSVGPVTEVQANFLGTIRSNVNRMATLVTDLSDVSRIEAGRLRLDFRAVPIAKTIEETVESQRALLDQKQQTLDIQIQSDLPNAWADPIRLGQVLTNLISNANKYSPQGSQVTLRAERAAATTGTGVLEMLHVSVEDTGYGISPDDQKKIFQKFFRSEDQNIRDASGTGLGLNITRNLVEMQGGQIWFESVRGKGTIFHFTIPIAANV